MVIHGTLTRISETEKSGNIRTEGGIIGYYNDDPEIGKAFCFYGKSLSFEGGVRIIQTSFLEKVEPFKINDQVLYFEFETENRSKYKLEINYTNE
jgi:hypothetical protein